MAGICHPPRALRDLLAASGRFFDRDMPVRIISPADGGSPRAVRLTSHCVVMEAHSLCRPVKLNDKSETVPVTLSDRVAQMYLDMVGDWNLPPLAGVCSTPLLAADGTVRSDEGYDASTGLRCVAVPLLQLPERPTRADAECAQQQLRKAFKTFPFADARRVLDPELGIEIVDTTQRPGLDESGFLVSLLTAVCRPSLWLAPGFLARAPEISGAGAGKGLLIRGICAIAHGTPPRAFTAGSERQELDKRLAAELIEGGPALFLDNVNGTVLQSATLASVLTERPARVRILGVSRMVALTSTAFIAVTGNGLSVSEDLARRFIVCDLDAHCEDPERRPFKSGFLNEIGDQRADLLAAVLVIWRWGRQNSADLTRGRTLGSFEQWGEWCRDPLLTLGCRDPVERIQSIKVNDPRRRNLVEMFDLWWEHHGSSPIKAAELAEPVRALADPQGRGRQHLSAYLTRITGTRAGGFVLTREAAAGKWGASTYALAVTDAAAGGN